MALFGYSGSGSQASIDPEYEKQVKMSSQKAREYRGQMPVLRQQQQTQASEGSRQQLAGRMADIKRGASSRGLLYSGLPQAAQSAASAQQAGALAQQRADVNAQLEGQAMGLESAAIQGGLGLQQAKQQVLDRNYENEMNQRMAKQRAVSGLLGTLGSLGGAAAGAGG